jgi:hypothetical protein
VEAIVHGEDIRRPLGITAGSPFEAGRGDTVRAGTVDLLLAVSGRPVPGVPIG